MAISSVTNGGWSYDGAYPPGYLGQSSASSDAERLVQGVICDVRAFLGFRVSYLEFETSFLLPDGTIVDKSIVVTPAAGDQIWEAFAAPFAGPPFLAPPGTRWYAHVYADYYGGTPEALVVRAAPPGTPWGPLRGLIP